MLSAVIPTYRRERVLVDTIGYLLEMNPPPGELLIVDQTPEHEPDTARSLKSLEVAGKIHWIRLARPSITHAMNVGLETAGGEIVLFLDDDIIPGQNLIGAHIDAHLRSQSAIIAGQVLQPGEEPLPESSDAVPFQFRSSRSQLVSELMGGNFSIRRDVALKLGGFDENFVHVAYRFEADFALRARAAGYSILFEPRAGIRHLKSADGGTRSFGHHLTTFKPSHAVGEYYFLLRSKMMPGRWFKMLTRPLRAVRTRHHLSHPWWVIPTFMAETAGFVWAVFLTLRGPRLLSSNDRDGTVE